MVVHVWGFKHGQLRRRLAISLTACRLCSQSMAAITRERLSKQRLRAPSICLFEDGMCTASLKRESVCIWEPSFVSFYFKDYIAPDNSWILSLKEIGVFVLKRFSARKTAVLHPWQQFEKRNRKFSLALPEQANNSIVQSVLIGWMAPHWGI